MAKSSIQTDYRRMVWDRLDDIPYPGEHTHLLGHDNALDQLTSAYNSGKMHHAWLLCGQKGVGKATLAFAMAAHILRHPDSQNAPANWVEPTLGDPLHSRISRGGHPNLLHLSRPWDGKSKTFKSKLSVDEIRRTVSFFGTTSGEDNWRVCIVDCADDMNTSAANALLKILEEPPERTIFFVLANAPGRILATIRSRCRKLSLRALPEDMLIQALDGLGADTSKLPSDDKQHLARLAGGSVRRALVLLGQDGLDLFHQFARLLHDSKTGLPDWPAIHGLADALSRKNKQDQYRLLFDIAHDHINTILLNNTSKDEPNGAGSRAQIIEQQTTLSNLARMCEVWDKTTQSAHLAEAYNLDKKQVILNLFGSLAQFR